MLVFLFFVFFCFFNKSEVGDGLDRKGGGVD